jgi:hypothetical protein
MRQTELGVLALARPGLPLHLFVDLIDHPQTAAPNGVAKAL